MHHARPLHIHRSSRGKNLCDFYTSAGMYPGLVHSYFENSLFLKQALFCNETISQESDRYPGLTPKEKAKIVIFHTGGHSCTETAYSLPIFTIEKSSYKNDIIQQHCSK